MLKVKSAFTIVELLIVIVVIAILASISIVAYNGIQTRANNTAAMSLARQVGSNVLAYHAQQGKYPVSTTEKEEANIPSDDNLQYNATDTTFCLTATSRTSSYYVSDTQTTPTLGGCPGHGVGGVAAVTNLALNPSLETSQGGLAGWSTNNAAPPSGYPASRSTTIARTGSASVRAYTISGGDNVTLLSLYSVGGTINTSSEGLVATPGTTYTMTVHFRSGVAHQGIANCNFRVSGAFGTSVAGSWVTGTAGSWTAATVTCTAPAGADRMRFGMNVRAIGTVPANTEAWADDAIITEGTAAPGYADGNSTNWVWNGAAHNSTSKGPAL